MSGRNYFKTTLLLAALSGLLLLVGQALGGGRWLTIMLLVAIGINGLSYFFSDKIALRASRARPVTEAQFPELYAIVNGLAVKANIPTPRLYVSPSPQPNAFATGRNPRHAAVAVTQGIMPLLDRRELEGVLAHELSHVRNRDILISSVAATIGAVITWLAHLAWFLPIGTAVTVTNLDNGHTVKCVIADRTGVPDDRVIVLDTTVFEQLADLVEAPIPVTISWQ